MQKYGASFLLVRATSVAYTRMYGALASYCMATRSNHHHGRHREGRHDSRSSAQVYSRVRPGPDAVVEGCGLRLGSQLRVPYGGRAQKDKNVSETEILDQLDAIRQKRRLLALRVRRLLAIHKRLSYHGNPRLLSEK